MITDDEIRAYVRNHWRDAWMGGGPGKGTVNDAALILFSTTTSYEGFTYRITPQRTVLVTWPRGSWGYSTELGLRYQPYPTAHGTAYELVLYRMFGAELPSDVFDWVIGEVAPMVRDVVARLNGGGK